MTNNQKSETEDFVQTFYSLIYEKFNKIINESIDKTLQLDNKEDLEDKNFISSFDKYFKNFVENGFFKEEKGNPYLEFHTEKEENFVFINKYIKNVKDKAGHSPFKTCQILAKEMGYDYKKYASQNENENKMGFRIPYYSFERQIKIYAFEHLTDGYLNKRKEALEKENEELKKKLDIKKRDIAAKMDKIYKNEKYIKALEYEIKDSKAQNEKLSKENSEFNSSDIIQKTHLSEANKKLEENNKLINTLVYKFRKQSSEFEKFKKNYAVVIYNIWRMGRNIEKDNKFNKQNSESINILIELVGKNLEYNDGFEDKEVDLEFLENQKLLINESLKSLERTYKQYDRVRILLEKSGIKIEEYDDIKNIDKLNVTILDVIESSEVQEIIVETVKPSIYYAEKRIFEGEVIVTKPKN